MRVPRACVGLDGKRPVVRLGSRDGLSQGIKNGDSKGEACRGLVQKA